MLKPDCGGWLPRSSLPILTNQAANARAELDATGNWKPSKKKSNGRIDGIVALCMAVAMVSTSPVV